MSESWKGVVVQVVDLILDEKIVAIFVLGWIAMKAIGTERITDPTAVVAGVVGAIAGFVAAQGVEKIREKRRLVSEETKNKVIDLEKERERKNGIFAGKEQAAAYAAAANLGRTPNSVYRPADPGRETEVPPGEDGIQRHSGGISEPEGEPAGGGEGGVEDKG